MFLVKNFSFMQKYVYSFLLSLMFFPLCHGANYQLGRYDPDKQYTKYIAGLTTKSQSNVQGDSIATFYYQNRRDGMKDVVSFDVVRGVQSPNAFYEGVAGKSTYFWDRSDPLHPLDLLVTKEDFANATENYAWIRSRKYATALTTVLNSKIGGMGRSDILYLLNNVNLSLNPNAFKVILQRYKDIGMDSGELLARIDNWILPQYVTILDNIETYFDNNVVAHLDILRRIVSRINSYDMAQLNAAFRFMDPVDRGFLAKLVSVKGGILVNDAEVGSIIQAWQRAAVPR